MLPIGFLKLSQINLDHPATSKKKTLEAVSELLVAGGSMLTPESIYQQLLERERLGSTGLANGIALPHARMIGLTQATGAFLRLRQGVDFDALDEQPADLIFALLVPESSTEEHLHLLANLAGMFKDADLSNQIRQAESTEEVLRLLQQDAAPDNAA